jgi:redox-sensing transcriptional repressor
MRELLLLNEQSCTNVSSRKLADSLHLNPPQIRKDLSYFGDFGTPGVGYDTKKLLEKVRGILKLNSIHKAALVGLGNIGAALLRYSGFEAYGLEIVAVFDNDKRKVGKTVRNIKVQDISKIKLLKNKNIKLGIIAVPAETAQAIADQLVNSGIKGILNFAPHYLSVPKKVKVITIDIAMDLARMPYYLPNGS